MKFDDQVFFYLLFGIGVGILNWFIARWKLRDRYCWFLLGLVLNLLSLFILFFLPSLQPEYQGNQILTEDDYSAPHKKAKLKQRCLYGFYFLVTIFLLYILFRLLHRFIV